MMRSGGGVLDDDVRVTAQWVRGGRRENDGQGQGDELG